MTFSGSSEWSGVFMPIRKHRLYTGDIGNHIAFKSIVPATADAIEEFNEDIDNDYEFDELTQLGDPAETEWIVTMAFIPAMIEEAYTYRICLPAMQPGESRGEALKTLADQGTVIEESNIPDPHRAEHLIMDYITS